MDALFYLFDIDNINQINSLLLDSSLRGFAVTIPYKEKICNYLDFKDDIVKKVGACNCVKVAHNKLWGHNTDVVGFEKSFTKELKKHHQKALILGDGGAAKAVKYVLDKLDILYTTIKRNPKDSINCLTYEQINQATIKEHQIIINTTPLGTYPNTNECPNIPYEFLNAYHYLFDLVYNPIITSFMQRGIEKNATVKNGYEMLCIQAEENWKIWNTN